MKPRWLVIAAVLPTKDVMYLQYNVPTIIMSRACDQFTKVTHAFLIDWKKRLVTLHTL